MKTLIFGGAGFVGSNIGAVALKKGWQVGIADRVKKNILQEAVYPKAKVHLESANYFADAHDHEIRWEISRGLEIVLSTY